MSACRLFVYFTLLLLLLFLPSMGVAIIAPRPKHRLLVWFSMNTFLVNKWKAIISDRYSLEQGAREPWTKKSERGLRPSNWSRTARGGLPGKLNDPSIHQGFCLRHFLLLSVTAPWKFTCVKRHFPSENLIFTCLGKAVACSHGYFPSRKVLVSYSKDHDKGNWLNQTRPNKCKSHHLRVCTVLQFPRVQGHHVVRNCKSRVTLGLLPSVKRVEKLVKFCYIGLCFYFDGGIFSIKHTSVFLTILFVSYQTLFFLSVTNLLWTRIPRFLSCTIIRVILDPDPDPDRGEGGRGLFSGELMIGILQY